MQIEALTLILGDCYKVAAGCEVGWINGTLILRREGKSIAYLTFDGEGDNFDVFGIEVATWEGDEEYEDSSLADVHLVRRVLSSPRYALIEEI